MISVAKVGVPIETTNYLGDNSRDYPFFTLKMSNYFTPPDMINEQMDESLNGGGDVSFLNTDYNIIIYWQYLVLQQNKCSDSVLMKVKAQWAMLFDG